MVPGVLLEPYMSQGDQGVAETPIVSKGLNCGTFAASLQNISIYTYKFKGFLDKLIIALKA